LGRLWQMPRFPRLPVIAGVADNPCLSKAPVS